MHASSHVRNYGERFAQGFCCPNLKVVGKITFGKFKLYFGNTILQVTIPHSDQAVRPPLLDRE